MIKVKITRNTVANKQAVVEGQIVELPDSEAKFLIGIKKAVLVETKGRSDPAIETADMQAPIETADVKRPKVKKAGE